ncbi:MAG: hypothetical protein C0483_23600 [Pirellula sp.]|nr:hypothetical protein [Pirellula sp.]
MNQHDAATASPETFATFEMHGSVLVVKVQLTEIRDTKTSYDFRDVVLAQLARQPVVHIVFDCAAVKFIGSVGFLAFLGVRRAQPTGRIVLCNLQTQIREMFQICRLLARNEMDTAPPFEASATPETALAMLHAQ